LYKFNTKIVNIEKADVCILIGVDPRKEAAIINLQLRKRYINGNFKVINVGSVLNLTFPCSQVGSTANDIISFCKGQNKFCPIIRKAKQPIIIFGNSFLSILGESASRLIVDFITSNTRLLSKNWNGINFLSFEAAQVGAAEIGLGSNNKKAVCNLVYALGDASIEKASNSFIVYQGHQGNNNAIKADLILPGSAYTEKEATYMNMEGRSQKTQKALLPPGQARKDLTILLTLLNLLDQNNSSLKSRIVHIESYNTVKTNFFVKSSFVELGCSKIKTKFLTSSHVNNFYLSDPISRASPTMSKCSKQLLLKSPFLV